MPNPEQPSTPEAKPAQPLNNEELSKILEGFENKEQPAVYGSYQEVINKYKAQIESKEIFYSEELFNLSPYALLYGKGELINQYLIKNPDQASKIKDQFLLENGEAKNYLKSGDRYPVFTVFNLDKQLFQKLLGKDVNEYLFNIYIYLPLKIIMRFLI